VTVTEAPRECAIHRRCGRNLNVILTNKQTTDDFPLCRQATYPSSSNNAFASRMSRVPSPSVKH
jgi:hypothetical protein